MTAFRPFANDHLAALATVAASALWAFRSGRGERLLALLVPSAMLSLMALDAHAGVSWRSWAPLQLCDVTAMLAASALWAKDQRAFELTLFWGGAGALPALLTPDVAEGFPHWRFLLYFAQHGGILVAAALLLGAGMRPAPGGPWRALAWLNVLALFVGIVDGVTGANFMYLRAKPGAHTPLDLLGPWPWYIVACEGVALGAFWLVALGCRSPQPGAKSIG